jgi:Flp pilus assembly protein TadB
MKKMLCGLLVLSVMSAAVPVRAASSESSKSPEAKPISAAIMKAGSDLASAPAAAPQARAQKVPTSLPRSGSNRIRKQGKAGMIIGLVSTLAGVAATVYMVKELKKDTGQDN